MFARIRIGRLCSAARVVIKIEDGKESLDGRFFFFVIFAQKKRGIFANSSKSDENEEKIKKN